MGVAGTNWFEVAQLAGLIVTVGLAAIAAKQARDTVRETRAMRREERLADLAVHLNQYASNVQGVDRLIAIDKLRLEAATDATGEELPACRALLEANVRVGETGEVVLASCGRRLRSYARSWLRPATRG